MALLIFLEKDIKNSHFQYRGPPIGRGKEIATDVEFGGRREIVGGGEETATDPFLPQE